jgi:hypothetical protein
MPSNINIQTEPKGIQHFVQIHPDQNGPLVAGAPLLYYSCIICHLSFKIVIVTLSTAYNNINL